LDDPADFVPSGPGAHQVATPEQISQMKHLMERGFHEEAAAARFNASCHVHLRGNAETGEPEEGLEEVLAASEVTGAPLQMVHINSSSLSHAPQMLRMIAKARSHGVDVTTEMYTLIPLARLA
jgi:hypothetical protein